jgi:nucleoside-diphosphate-sugar epimerase
MKVLLTGHTGYIGSVMAAMLGDAGHDVRGWDSGFFAPCTLGEAPADDGFPRDVRDVAAEDLTGLDAVIHLAALSNDPLGNLNPDLTLEINHRASVRLARAAKAAGVKRFLFASSCSLYGVAGESMLDESAAFSPVTVYGESKVLVERDVRELADDDFSPTFMRNATAYGLSPRLRADVVVNNLVGHALVSGDVLIQSDGTPWRPLVHVEDFCAAFLAVLVAPREIVHNESFNVGRTSENYRVRDLADMVQSLVPGSRIRYAEGAGPDPRSYRVDCSKLQQSLPGYRPQWTVERGIRQLRDAFARHGLTEDEFLGDRYFRIRHIQRLRREGRLDDRLRWLVPAAAASQELVPLA